MQVMLEEACRRAQAKDGTYKFGTAPVPRFGERPDIPRIVGQATSKNQNNNRREKGHRRVLHFECSTDHVVCLQLLIDMFKNFCWWRYCGAKAHT